MRALRDCEDDQHRLREPKGNLRINPVEEVVSLNSFHQHDYIASHGRSNPKAENGITEKEVATIHSWANGDTVWKVHANGAYTTRDVF